MINKATASVSQTVVPANLNDPAVVVANSTERTVTVPALQQPALSVAKQVKPNTPSTYSETTDVITYLYTVTNSGNVTITDPITIADDKINSNVPQPCSNVDLAPGQSTSCELQFSPSQQQINDGSVTNIATPGTTFGTLPVSVTTDSATIFAVQKPELTLTKELQPLPNNSFAAGVMAE